MNYQQLKRFCSTETNRPALMEPFLCGDYVCASSGMMCIWEYAARHDYIEPCSKWMEEMVLIFMRDYSSAKKFMPLIIRKETSACPTCNTDHAIKKYEPIIIGKSKIREQEIALLDTLKNVRIGAIEGKAAGLFAFTFDGGSGILQARAVNEDPEVDE